MFFRIGARVNRNTVEPPPPQPRMTITMMDASSEALWLAGISAAAGYAVFVVSDTFSGRGARHMISHACPN